MHSVINKYRAQTAHPQPSAPSLSLLALALIAASLMPHASHAQPRGMGVVALDGREDDAAWTDRLIVKYRGDSSSRRTVLAARTTTVQALHKMGLSATLSHRNAQGAHVIRLSANAPEAQLRLAAKALMAADPSILYAEPDSRMQAFATPSDPMYNSQWDYYEAIGGINAPGAWDLSTGNGVVVAVVDTGVRPHADLVDNLLNGYDFVTETRMSHDGNGRDSDAYDPGDGCNSGVSSWHGTHVAGTIAAASNNGLGVAGIAWNAKILPVRALGCGGGYNSDIADGLVWAAGQAVGGIAAPSQAAKVINMSLGGQGACSTTMQTAIQTARRLGATVVVAAGNANIAVSKFSPANCKGVITVAATGRAGGRAPYSNYGPEVDLAAPGGNMSTGSVNGILSTLNTGGATPGNDNYQYYQGTSMAAPHVAGVAALMLARNPSLTPDEVEVLLKSSARAFPGACVGCGSGIVNATAAVNAVFVSAAMANDVNELEPDDSYAQAQSVSRFPSKINGTMARVGDLDTYRVTVPVRSTLVARLISNTESDYNLAFRNSSGSIISVSQRAKGLTDRLSWTNNGRATATIYVRVSRLSGGVGDTAGAYTLELSR